MLKRPHPGALVALASVAATTAVAAVPAAASYAPPNVTTRVFKIEVTGKQTTVYDYKHVAQAQCDVSASGSGGETVTFASRAAEKIELIRFGRNEVFFGRGKLGDDEVSAKARVSRHSSYSAAPGDPKCGGAGGGGKAPPKDCGTRRAGIDLRLAWLSRKGRTGITLDRGTIFPLGKLYRNCVINGLSFPALLQADTRGRPIVAAIPAGDLFNRHLRKHIVLAHGRFVSRDEEGGYTTTLAYTISLTAVKR